MTLHAALCRAANFLTGCSQPARIKVKVSTLRYGAARFVGLCVEEFRE
jgi:hypothetical protein